MTLWCGNCCWDWWRYFLYSINHVFLISIGWALCEHGLSVAWDERQTHIAHIKYPVAWNSTHLHFRQQPCLQNKISWGLPGLSYTPENQQGTWKWWLIFKRNFIFHAGVHVHVPCWLSGLYFWCGLGDLQGKISKTVPGVMNLLWYLFVSFLLANLQVSMTLFFQYHFNRMHLWYWPIYPRM